MTGGYTVKEKNIRELAKHMGLITVENMCQYTIAQLVYMVANKVNELVDEVWRFETDVQELLKTQNENIQYLLGEGLHLEVENIFDGWIQDGIFDLLINQTALKKVNERIDETNAQLSHRTTEQKVRDIITEFQLTGGEVDTSTLVFKSDFNEIDGIVRNKSNNILNPNINRLENYDIKYNDSNCTVENFLYTADYTTGVVALAKTLDCEPNTTYSVIRKNGSKVGVNYILFDYYGNFIEGGSSKNQITTPSNCYKLAVSFANADNVPGSICKVIDGVVSYQEYGYLSTIKDETNLINNRINDIENDIFTTSIVMLENLTFKPGVQLVDGTFNNTTSFSHTDIKVAEGEVYYITGYNFYSNLLYAVLDQSGNVIKKVQESGSGVSILYTDEKVVIPAGGVTLRVNKREPAEGTLFIPTVKKEVKSQTAIEKIKSLENNINSTLFSRTNALVDMSKLKKGKAIITWTTNVNMNDESTYLYNSDGRIYTELYPVKAGDIYKSAFKHKSQQPFICMLFDIYGNFASVTDSLVTEIRVEKDGFIIFDFPNEKLVPEAIVKVSNTNDFPRVEPYLKEKFEVKPHFENEKPLDVIDKTGGYMSIFHNFGVIGDSLASGNMEGVDSSGTYVYRDFLDYSWGKSIERATGCTYHRFSRGGQYLHDNNWFDEWKDKIETELCSAYIICIGFNDYNWLKEDPSRYGTIADIKSDYTQNPNTLYGQYAKMIQLIKSVQPKARIFLCNMEWNNTDDSRINTVISDLANHFDYCYLIDLYTYAHEPFWGVENIYKTGVYHKNTLGYQKMAWDVMSYIDYIVRHNMEEFIDVQFIGTDLRLPTDEEIENQK